MNEQLPLPILHAGPGSIFIPTPASFVSYITEMNSRFVAYENENMFLKQALERETLRADNNQAVIDGLRDEVMNSKPKTVVSELEDNVKRLAMDHASAMGTMQRSLSGLEKDIADVLSDPRLKDLDRKLVRLGRELKKNEGANRVIMELQTENAFLHNEIDALNSLLKGCKAAEGEFKKFKIKMFETNRKLELQACSMEAIIRELEDDRRKLAEAFFMKAASDAIAANRSG